VSNLHLLHRIARFWIVFWIVSSFMFAPFILSFRGVGVAHAQLGAIISVLGALGIIDKATTQIQNTIQFAGNTLSSDALSVLQNINSSLTSFSDELERKYQNNLNITIASLDAVAQNSIISATNLANQVNDILEQNIGRIEDATLTVLRTASDELQTNLAVLRQDVQDTIIVTVNGVAYVLDVAFLNTLTIVSLIALVVVLLIFIFLLFTRRFPQGLQGILVAVLGLFALAVTGATFLVPDFRSWIMVSTNLGLRGQLTSSHVPELVGLEPRSVVLDTNGNPSFAVRGVNLMPSATPPNIQVDNTQIDPSYISYGDREIDVNIRQLPAPANNSVTVQLNYGSAFSPLNAPLTLMTPTPQLGPADLAVTNITIDRTTPIIRQQVNAVVTVTNHGQRASNTSLVTLTYIPGATVGNGQQVPVLQPGASSTHPFQFSYGQPGTYDLVANVTAANGETNGSDNIFRLAVTVNDIPKILSEITVGMSGTWPGGGGEPGQTLPFLSQPVVIPANCQLDTSRGGDSFQVENIDHPEIKYTISYPTAGYYFNILDGTFWRSLSDLRASINGNVVTGIVTLKGLGGHGIFASRGPERFNANFIVYTRCDAPTGGF